MKQEFDPLEETAILGKEAENFLASDIGKYLLARAEEEARTANAHLKSVFPMRWWKIMELQNQIKVAESIQRWLADAISDGAAALRTLEGEQDG